MLKYSSLLLIFIFTNTIAQNLYPEKFDGCITEQFCLDCGDPKAQPGADFMQQLITGLDAKTLAGIKGLIEVQILVDAEGKPCLLSADNKTNVKSRRLGLQKAINATTGWKSAMTKGKGTMSSVSFLFNFADGQVTAQRRDFGAENQSNMQGGVGEPDIKGSKAKDLTGTWIVYNKQNSKLPWDMTRAVATDANGSVWIGTDNGIVNVVDGVWELYTYKNTQISSEKYDTNKTSSVRSIAVDKNNNKWFIAGWNVYKYDNKNWTVYDSLNSPISWAREMFVDRHNNIWFTSWNGVAKFDGKKWSQITTANSKLPGNKTMGVFADSKDRVWIGTFDGNIRIEGDKTTTFKDTGSPLAKAIISQMYEDKAGNLWFSLYDDKGHNGGMFVLRTNGTWEKPGEKQPELFAENSINCFLLDENNATLWASLNNVGILKYRLSDKIWEVYTRENSNVPSVNIEQITKDKDGAIWAATYAGVIKLDIK